MQTAGMTLQQTHKKPVLTPSKHHFLRVNAQMYILDLAKNRRLLGTRFASGFGDTATISRLQLTNRIISEDWTTESNL
jgi:hypothetical protein